MHNVLRPQSPRVVSDDLKACGTEDYENFLVKFPQYTSTSIMDEIRADDFGRLDATDVCYLDYGGGGLCPDSLLQRYFEWLRNGVYGNPHSANPTSMTSTRNVLESKAEVMRFFSADESTWDLAWTTNSSAALKLVGESFPFGKGTRLLITADNHNSCNGIREFAISKGAVVTYLQLQPDLRIAPDAVKAALAAKDVASDGLFIFPAQSNFSGIQHPLEWIEWAHASGWTVMLDPSAFVPTNELDLAKHTPDFICVSFYKMIGFPTGCGALLGQKASLAKLQRPWFGGGTVQMATTAPVSDFNSALSLTSWFALLPVAL